MHWADISPAPFGVVATSLDLLRLILGIGYIALDNVENNVARKNTGVKLLVPWFIWLFYAVIAPLNLFLLIGAFALLADPLVINFKTSPINTFAALTLFGLIFAVFGHLRSKAARTYLDKLIMRGLCACGVVTVAFALMFVAGTDLPYQEIIAPKCNTFADDSALCELTYFTNLGVIVLKLSWLIAVLSLMMLVLVSMPGARSHLWEKRSIYLAVCSAMLILWMTVTVAIWMLAIEMITRLPGSEAMSGVAIIDAGFKDATQTLVYGVLSLLGIAAMALFVAVWRNRVKDQLSELDTQSSDIDKKYGRVILNPWLNIALFIGILITTFATGIAFFEFLVTKGILVLSDEYVWSKVYAWALEQDKEVKAYKTIAFFVISLIGFALLRLSDKIASGIGVARDVTSYLTRTDRANPLLSNMNSHYVYADEIQARFNAVVNHVLHQEGRENISRITFMSHSQGTVVAAVGLQMGAQDLPVKPTLITMGSPLTHIYGHYFSENYQFTPPTNAALERWFNIYRRDDFVGTRVHGNGTDAENFKIRPKGHSHYWSDTLVWKIFKERGVF